MTLERRKRDFDRDGVLVLRGFLSQGELDELRSHTERCLNRVTATDGYEGVVKGLQKIDPWFLQQLTGGKQIELISALLDANLEPATAGWFDRIPGEESGIRPHVDAIGHGRSGATLWIALDRADRDNGCLFYVKGSHRQQLPLEYDLKGFSSDSEGAVAIEAVPGDAIIHHSLTVHWSEPNRSQCSRQAITYFYFAAPSGNTSQQASGARQ